MQCRHCSTILKNTLLDLFNAPPSNSYLKHEQLNESEVYYPLKVYICHKCFLVQVDEHKNSREIFDAEYAYFSSYSISWLEHAKNYVDNITKTLMLDKKSFVTEIASNDGYLLQYLKEKDIPCLGIEPTESTAKVARAKGLDVLSNFFTSRLAQTLQKSDLIIGNNVLAHVPDINDFVTGLKIALKPYGTITLEFPHLLKLLKFSQFDTIYHEHFSYLSLLATQKIFEAKGLKIYHVEELETHGGSLRIYSTHKENNLKVQDSVNLILEKEKRARLDSIDGYKDFSINVIKIKIALLDFILNAKKANKKIAAYGAAAKGNTLLNYCGVKADLISFVVDISPYKQDKYMPGSHIPIVAEDYLKEYKPDYILILPWNLKQEIIEQLYYVRQWDAKFVTAIPTLEIS